MKLRYDKSEKAERERTKKYGCNGKCYTNTSMCERAEICDETRLREWLATVIAVGIIFGTIALFVFLLIFGYGMIINFSLSLFSNC